jgi:hypothetical protein
LLRIISGGGLVTLKRSPRRKSMTEHQTNRASPADPMCEMPKSSQTEPMKATARETTEELKRKGAEMAHETKETARQLKDEAIHAATEAARQAQQQAAGYADEQKDRVADELRTFGEAMSRAADKLREEEDVRVAGYADMAASQFSSAADYLRTRNLGDLMGDVESFARHRPELFFGATFLVGMGIARFLKASHRRGGRHDDQGHYDGESPIAIRAAAYDATGPRPGARPQAQHSASRAGMKDPLSYH